ncbi:hypothetical protein [Elizabethkingia anophelis]|uniref:hypothetical protein n=1 Tax=Elizabethkingia anophelis TaxID=1117645 RepID=UPI0022279B5B|nr:hypothetical protein [Elizabethkingia anophelis]MCW2463377.1 hypothetical protein [Elizabethkingia anophelis]MCW2467062.1 hypothetical protein [Elizabethkingia anophelis]MCW2470790.1 hypothetical protein [Elizabethkingia anophelis]HBI9690662.1 hypothetical protein [Elizabethkingia anophelis]HBI9694681.1 hypothetical protein [Elizabethkingia anophelis]
MRIYLSIDCPTYLKKFVEKTFGSEIEVNHNDRFGIFVSSLLKKKTLAGYHPPGKKTSGYKEKLKLSISVSHADKNGFFLIHSDEQKIVKFLEDEFRKNLYTMAIFNQQCFDLDYKVTIVNYLDFMGITEEELQYESIRKDFNRRKEEIINKLYS